MNRIVLTLSLFLISALSSLAVTPQRVIDRAANRLKSSPSVQVAYTVKADGQTSQGMLTISGDRFTVTSPGMISWYDGKTQWTYSEQMGEVNVVTPTPDELRQINPLTIISALPSDFRLQSAKAPKGQTAVDLTAKTTRSDIRKALITFSDATGLPTSIRVTLSGGHKLDISVNSVTPGGALPATYFKFDPKKYPGVQVVDLR
ncbi:MAG: hypothetical protein NC039_05200 [Muribaculaceae bacterium]|nr:hypothetical protein [Muribaculaceae bacterium]